MKSTPVMLVDCEFTLYLQFILNRPSISHALESSHIPLRGPIGLWGKTINLWTSRMFKFWYHLSEMWAWVNNELHRVMLIYAILVYKTLLCMWVSPSIFLNNDKLYVYMCKLISYVRLYTLIFSIEGCLHHKIAHEFKTMKTRREARRNVIKMTQAGPTGWFLFELWINLWASVILNILA
jgi:hypothetical protein